MKELQYIHGEFVKTYESMDRTSKIHKEVEFYKDGEESSPVYSVYFYEDDGGDKLKYIGNTGACADRDTAKNIAKQWLEDRTYGCPDA